MGFETISAKELENYIGKKDYIIIDLRETFEYQKGHVPTAINIPYQDSVNWDCIFYQYRYYKVILYCERGNTSLLVARDLAANGYWAISVAGGIHLYRGKLVIDSGENLIHNEW